MRDEWKLKLVALLEGLQTEHIELLMSSGKIEDFRNYGKAYYRASEDKQHKKK